VARGPYGKPLYPADLWLAAKVDEIIDAFDDLWILLAPTYRIQDQPLREKARQQLFQPGGEAAVLMDTFESILAKSSTGYVVSEAGFTVADLVYFCSLSTIRSGFIDGLAPRLFNDLCYERVMKHKEMVARIPAIQGYYDDSKASNPLGLPFYEVFKPGM